MTETINGNKSVHVVQNGERFTYMEFEEPEDGPEVVEQHEKERQQRRRRRWKWRAEEIELTETRVRRRRAMLQAEEERIAGALRQKHMR